MAYIDWKQGFYDDVLSGKTAYYSNLVPELMKNDLILSDAPVQGLAQADLALQGLVDEGEELLPVFGQAALQGQIVRGVVAGEVQRVHVQMLDEQAALLQNVVGASRP